MKKKKPERQINMKSKVHGRKSFLYIAFMAGLLLINFNSNLNIIIISLLVLSFIFCNLKHNFYMYIFFMPFDEILVIPMLGSIYRVFQLIIIIKFFYLGLKGKVEFTFKRSDFLLLVFLGGYVSCSFINYKDINILGLVINILIVIMLRRCFYENLDHHLSKIFKLFIISTCTAIVWGLIHRNFILGGDQEIHMMRFSGTQEPNVMALYINIALLFLLYIDWSFKRKIITFIFLYTGLFLTVSMSGLMLNVIVLSLYLILNKNIKLYINYIVWLTISVLSIIWLKDYLSVLDVPLARLQEKISFVLQGNYNSATTGRANLNSIYLNEFNQLNIYQKLFGIFTFNNKNILSYLNFNKINVSHNTYIDMLFSLGILGSFLFLGYAIKNLFSKITSEYFKCLLLLKLIIFISGFTLSMFNTRYFYVWMML